MTLATMLCRLYGEPNALQFKLEWVPLIHHILDKGNIFNWAVILSSNLKRQVEKILTAPPGFTPQFFMSGYLIDAFCAKTHFPLMKWSWSPSQQPIHVYCNKLWSLNAKQCFYEVCNNFMIPLHQLLYGYPPPRFSNDAMESISSIGDWFIEDTFSYISIYGCEAPPHVLPRYVPDRLVLREIVIKQLGHV
jgi:hypothetical protein